jgi:hypothetical protein
MKRAFRADTGRLAPFRFKWNAKEIAKEYWPSVNHC